MDIESPFNSNLGVSKYRGGDTKPPKWMVENYMENPIMDDLGGYTTIFGNIQLGLQPNLPTSLGVFEGTLRTLHHQWVQHFADIA